MTTESPRPTRPAAPDASGFDAVQDVNWSDFRDHLSTADQEGRRKWLYPKKPRGRFHRARAWVAAGLVALMFAGPFVRINGNPLLLLNIVDRKFVILGQVFWPQDMALFALALLLFLTGIAVFTAAFGRLWCGWACPQTVLMEMVFRKLEYWIEGDAYRQRALARAPWAGRKILKKVSKHAIFLVLSFLIGNILLSYFIGSEALFQLVTDDPRRHVTGLSFMLLFTVVFYGIFARFREQACTFICPYGRFQSTLIDENTIVVAYDHPRGEQRRHWRRGDTAVARQALGAGDCVDCRQCVTVCPTGIDIRDGTQMECVHCTACIDACDAIMDKLKRPRGLIRYASLNGIERGERLRLTPRLVGYSVVLLLLTIGFIALLVTRSDVDATLLRAPGALFQPMPDGKVSNLYLLKLTNKTRRQIPIQVKLERPDGRLTVLGGELNLPADKQTQASVLVELAPQALTGGSAPVIVTVSSQDRLLERLKTTFVGPRSASR